MGNQPISGLRVAFLGTPPFAASCLVALMDGPDSVVGVVCQPDRPVGRHQELQWPPVKTLAASRAIPVLQPVQVRGEAFLESLREWNPDLAIVAAYGRILPRPVLDVPRLGCVNVHASLLPKYRGAAPIQWAIARGERVTGVTIIQMNDRMDEGDVLFQQQTQIGPDETYGELQERLATVGAEALMAALVQIRAGTASPQPQDASAATMAPIIRKEDGAVDWTAPADDIACKVRGFNPWPSAHTHLGGRLVKIHRARSHGEGVAASPGTIIGIDDSVRVATGSGVLCIDELQLEGRRRLPAGEFARGGAIVVGGRFGDGPRTR